MQNYNPLNHRLYAQSNKIWNQKTDCQMSTCKKYIRQNIGEGVQKGHLWLMSNCV